MPSTPSHPIHSFIAAAVVFASAAPLALFAAEPAPKPEVAPPEAVAAVDDSSTPAHRIATVVVSVSREHGNLDTKATATDLARLGLKPGDRLLAIAGDKRLELLWGNTYADVEEGEGVALIHPDGFVRLARYYDSAATALGVSVGDTVHLRPVELKTLFFNRGALAEITEIDPHHGNIETALTSHDLHRLGIQPGDRFVASAGEKRLEFTWGATYSDVPEGEGIAFVNWANHIRLARNHENAAKTLGVKAADSVFVRPLGE